MQVAVTKQEGLKRLVEVTVPADKVSAAFDARFNALAKTAKIDGFRPGKVPMAEIEKRFGDKVEAEVSQALYQQFVPAALQQEKLQPAGQPHIHGDGELKNGADFKFHIHFEAYPEVTPKGYDKLKLVKETAEPTDSMVEDGLKRLLSQTQSYKKVDRAAKEGDQVTIDSVGTLDGETDPFEGGRLADHKIVIGSGMLIDGFESGLTGLKAGDEKDLKLTFPKDYHAEKFAGKKVTFATTVKEVAEPEHSEPSDAWAKQFEVKDLAELKVKIKERLAQDLAMASEQRLKRTMFDALDKDHKFETPSNMVESEFNAIWQQHVQDLGQRGMSPSMLDISEDEQRVEYRILAERRVRLGLLLTAIGEAEKIEVTQQEIANAIEERAAQYGDQGAAVREYFNQPQNRQMLVGPLFEQKVVDLLLEKNKPEEKKVKPEELLAEIGA